MDERVILFRKILAKRQLSAGTTSLTPTDISQAVTAGMTKALAKFSTKDGSLRIADRDGWKPYGGG